MNVADANDQDWRTVRAVVQNACVLIGPHGGALSSMVFMPPGAQVVEFMNETAGGSPVRNCFLGLATGLGHTLWRYRPPVFGYNTVMTVEVANAIDIIRLTDVFDPSC